MDTTRLRQVEGGTVIKQADRASTMTFILQDSLGREVNLNGQQAQIALYTLGGRYWETKARVDKARVSFNLPGNLSEDDYILDISVAGYVFPSDRDFIIRVVKGYKDLLSKERADKAKKSFEDLMKEAENQTSIKLNKQIEELENIGNKKLGEIDETNKSYLKIVDNKISADLTLIGKKGDEYIKLLGTKSSSVIREIEDKNKEVIKEVNNKVSEIEENKNNILGIIETKIKTITDSVMDKVKPLIKSLLEDKVDKQPGKILTDNNFSNDYKNKLDKLNSNVYKRFDELDTTIRKKVDKEERKPITINLINGLTGWLMAQKDISGGVCVWGGVKINNSDNLVKNAENWAVLPDEYKPISISTTTLYADVPNSGYHLIPGLCCNIAGEIYYKQIKGLEINLEDGCTCYFSFYFKSK